MISADATLIALRESLEAFLILSIFAGLVVKLGQRNARKPLLLGAATALAASILVGIVIDRTARDLFSRGGYGEVVEGVASLLAVLIITYMVVWMYRHTLHMVEEMRKKTVRALDAGQPLLLFSIAFVAVAREGLETVLFFATLAGSQSGFDLALSALVGLAASSLMAYLLFAGIVRLNIRRFFTATGVLLIFFAAGLLATSIHEFAEVGYLPETADAWNTEAVLDQTSPVGQFMKAVFGYRDSPSILEASAYVLYVLGFGLWYVRGLFGRVLRPTVTEATPQKQG